MAKKKRYCFCSSEDPECAKCGNLVALFANHSGAMASMSGIPIEASGNPKFDKKAKYVALGLVDVSFDREGSDGRAFFRVNEAHQKGSVVSLRKCQVFK